MEVRLSIPAAKHTNKQFARRFEQECTFLETLDHPNIVKYLATAKYPKDPEQYILVLELLDCNLGQFYLEPQNKQLSQRLQKKLCLDIASALAYIHSHQIVHADLCSDNILLDRKKVEPVAKVCDFGLSKEVDGKGASLLHLGRKGFLPPEAADINLIRYDSSYDIFSFGAIMVQIVRCLPTLESPQERTSELEKTKDHPLQPVIKQCLVHTKENRPSAEELKYKLSLATY